jgi:hypothetical protein
MGRRKTKVSLHPIGDGKLVDITDQYGELPAGTVARRAIVDDPSGGRQVIALRQIRDDPLGDLHSRGRIDDVLFRAGREWQRWYEMAQPSRLRCILGSGVVVAGGKGPRDSISDKQIRAVQWLRRSEAALGEVQNIIIHDVLGGGRSFRWVAAARGIDRDKVRSMFQEALEILAKLAGLSMTKAA